MFAKTFYVLLFCLALGAIYPQAGCGVSEIAFKSGESLDYEVYYHWGLIWANAGSANFTIKHAQFRNKKVFHIVSEGVTYRGYDWFYKVRDKYESWADTASLKPLRYIRNSNEGSNHVYNDNYFNFLLNQAVSFKIIKNKIKRDTVKITDCTLDVMTMIYYARCINYSRCRPGDKIPISLYLDGEVNDSLYIRYIGTEKIKTAIGEKNCIIFSPLLIKGTIFSGGEGMKVWVTNDEKKTPILIKTPIVVGEIQVKIKTITN